MLVMRRVCFDMFAKGSCQMGSILIDMHVHTRMGSLDSSIDPSSLATCAATAGLSGIVLVEHYRVWSESELQRWSTNDVRLFAGAEVDTDVGHVLGIGFTSFPRSRTISDLHQEALEAGAALILAHPFRAYLDSPHHWLGARSAPIDAAAARTRTYINGVEIENNGCTKEENRMAARLQRRMGLVGLAGSDAHVAHQIGRAFTGVARMPRDSRALAHLLRAPTGPDFASKSVAMRSPSKTITMEFC